MFAPKQVKSQQSAKKVMASVFWDEIGILLIDYLQKGKTINSEYYCSLLDQLDEKIHKKRPGLQLKKITFHQDNAPVHNGVFTMTKFSKLRYDFYVFREKKKLLQAETQPTCNDI